MDKLREAYEHPSRFKTSFIIFVFIILILIWYLSNISLATSFRQAKALQTEDIMLEQTKAEHKTLLTEIQSYKKLISDMKQELTYQRHNLSILETTIEQMRRVLIREKYSPKLDLPKRLLADQLPEDLPGVSADLSKNCKMHSCFDYSRCSLTSGFPVYFYQPDLYPVMNDGWKLEDFLGTNLKQVLGNNPHLTSDPRRACVYLIIIGEAINLDGNIEGSYSNILNSSALQKLPFWGGDGRNHILLNFARKDFSNSSRSDIHTGRAIIAQSTFSRSNYREGFDLVVPPLLGPQGGDVWQECAHMLPVKRKHLLSFQGYFPNDTLADNFTLNYLKEMLNTKIKDEFLFDFECPGKEKAWELCGSDSSRTSVLKNSTFVLVFAPLSEVSTTIFQARIYEALRSGSIPVILGDEVRLAYEEVIQWKRAVIFLPKARITELHFLLRSFPEEDIFTMRRQGRLIWERYLASVQSTVDTIVAVLRDRLNIPPINAELETSQSIFLDQPLSKTIPFDSSSSFYRRNYSLWLNQGYDMWNHWVDPFKLYPALPTDPLLPSDARFTGSGYLFDPTPQEKHPLGGNSPTEQFTVVMLTYDREKDLLDSISRLKGLDYLHSVVVVWNSPKLPNTSLRWPDIGVPVHVIKTARNSLNNRFLPLDIVQTEAIFSLDDDEEITHAEIMIGFRVWREHRDRIVGFPGRNHIWNSKSNNSWIYDSGPKEEVSMVLTGAAFLHRHYMYLYWKWLPRAIRDRVDEYMNCEDIAMNFLVSHMTRLPPIKVSSRWAFKCAKCGSGLSSGTMHYEERSRCINFFTKVFGYTPLLHSQYRAEPIAKNLT